MISQFPSVQYMYWPKVTVSLFLWLLTTFNLMIVCVQMFSSIVHITIIFLVYVVDLMSMHLILNVLFILTILISAVALVLITCLHSHCSCVRI